MSSLTTVRQAEQIEETLFYEGEFGFPAQSCSNQLDVN
jgi:hypothetical protein